MRDVILAAIVFGAVPFIVRSPALGVLVWAWLGLMNPHRLTWGFAYSLPFSQVVAIATLIGIFLTKEPRQWKGGAAAVFLLLFLLWTAVTTAFALEPERAFEMAQRVWKIQLVTFIALLTMYKREHAIWLVIVIVLSIGFYAVKGGAFTLATGGSYRVYGPEHSFIFENNSLALATVTTIPLWAYLFIISRRRWLKWAIAGAILLSAASALGSYSRGGLLAIGAMAVFMWLKGRQKVLLGMVLGAAATGLVAFMPSHWEERMASIGNYQEDESAQGRINTWIMLTRLAIDRPLVGGGFEPYSRKVFAEYRPEYDGVHSAHSIYFQVLGEHGFVGFGLFAAFWIATWLTASRLIRLTRGRAEDEWAHWLGRMIQVGLVGYFAGGAFLNLAYFDLPYYLMVLVVVAHHAVTLSRKPQTPASTASALTLRSRAAPP